MDESHQREKKEVAILLVEDDSGHARLIEKNLRRANITNEIIHLADGQAALDYLSSESKKAGDSVGLTLLVLLDLNLPVVDGYEVLKRMKEDEQLKCIPVVVLTTTDEPREINKCYELGCNVYVTKPVDYEQFSEAIRKLGLFISVVAFPR